MDPIEQVLRDHLKDGDVALDVGANVGNYTRIMAQLCSRVVAFEPNPELAAKLAESAPSNVEVVAAAVAERAGRAILHIDTREGLNAMASSLMVLNQLAGTTNDVEVPTLSLDEFCSARQLSPNLIKIDVEGYEPSVVFGARAVLRQHRPIVIFELWGGYFERVALMIEELSLFYDMVRIGDGQDISASRNDPNTSDILCLPRGN